MNKEFYHIYCKGILGVKTNVDGFKWVYGSTAPCALREEYENCAVKFDICVKPESQLQQAENSDHRFQSYTWDEKNKIISCRRTLFRKLKIGFNIRIDGNTVYAEIGRNYYKFVQNRTMNLHGVYYLLADLANIMLLKNGFLSLYASAVYSESRNKCVVHFAPPNTGKTITATKLCQERGYKLVGEDVVITDGQKVYACPWTNSYRKSSAGMDNAGAFGRVKKASGENIQEQCDLTDIVVLSLGEKKITADPDELLSKICILNGYLFGYYSTPIVKLLAYFNNDFRKPWYDCSAAMLEKMIISGNSRLLQSPHPADFYELVEPKALGE